MPDLTGIPVRRHQPLDPYDHIHDNQPIDDLASQIELVNDAVGGLQTTLAASVGTQPSLNARLNQSLEADGSLSTDAVDEANHSIEAHTDTDDYVRMTAAERAKLDGVAAEATDVAVVVPFVGDPDPTTFDSGDLEFVESDTVQFRNAGGKVALDIKIPLTAKHIHYYGVTPVTDDRLNFTTTSVPTAYKAGSLRVYVNGIRLTTDATVTVLVSGEATALRYEEGDDTSGVVTGGDFNLNIAVGAADVVRIDFDHLP